MDTHVQFRHIHVTSAFISDSRSTSSDYQKNANVCVKWLSAIKHRKLRLQNGISVNISYRNQLTAMKSKLNDTRL